MTFPLPISPARASMREDIKKELAPLGADGESCSKFALHRLLHSPLMPWCRIICMLLSVDFSENWYGAETFRLKVESSCKESRRHASLDENFLGSKLSVGLLRAYLDLLREDLKTQRPADCVELRRFYQGLSIPHKLIVEEEHQEEELHAKLETEKQSKPSSVDQDDGTGDEESKTDVTEDGSADTVTLDDVSGTDTEQYDVVSLVSDNDGRTRRQQQEIEELEEKMKALEFKKRELEVEIKKRQDIHDALKIENAESNSNNEKLEDLQVTIKNLRAAKQEMESKIQTLEQENRILILSFKLFYEEMEDREEDLTARIRKLNAKCNNHQTLKTRLENDLTKSNSENQDLKVKNQDLERQLNALKKDGNTAEKLQTEALETRFQAMEKKVQSVIQANIQSIGENVVSILHTNTQTAAHEVKAFIAQDDHQVLKKEMEALKDEKNAFRKEIEAFKDDDMALREKNKVCRQEMKSFCNEMKAFKDEIRAMQPTIDLLNRRMSHLSTMPQ